MDHHIDLALLDSLAHQVAQTGVAAHEPDIAVIVAEAAMTGAPSVVLAVLSDPAAPPAARSRAFGIVATWLARPERTMGDSPAVRNRDRQPRPSSAMIRASSPNLTVV